MYGVLAFNRRTAEERGHRFGVCYAEPALFSLLWNLTSSRVRASGPLAEHTKCGLSLSTSEHNPGFE